MFDKFPMLVWKKMTRKLSMELIRNKKSRNTTFQKRKKGLLKKTYELATLCGVDACTVVFGPNDSNGPGTQLETWPSNPDEVRRIISAYKASALPGKRSLDLSDFFEDRKKKVEKQIARARGEAMSTTFDDAINELSRNQVRELLGALDYKIEALKNKIELKKEIQGKMEEITAADHEVVGCSRNSMHLGVNNVVAHQQQQPTNYFQLLDSHGSISYPSDQGPHQMLSFDLRPMAPYPPMMMLLNDHNFTQFGGAPFSTVQPFYHDPMTIMQENVMLNNSGSLMTFDNHSAMMQNHGSSNCWMHP